ncbi:MAG: nucleoside monophosphate kinase [Candidatus Taylorbacteria bacterium]
MTSQKTVLFFGRAGSGKGTQAQLLAKYFKEKDNRDVLYIETGRMGREFVDSSSTSTSKIIKEVMAQGGLWPEFFPIWLWSDYLIKNFTGEEHIILDGVCRRLHEAFMLDSALKFYKVAKPYIFLIDIPNEEAQNRLLERGRNDDDKKSITARLQWFDKNVMESVNFFKTNVAYNFFSIDGKQSIEEVHREVVQKINSKLVS